MRRMSFGLTTRQMRERSKTVTRRIGWWNLKKGEELLAVEKCMGLRKGERQKVLGRIRVTDIVLGPLGGVTDEDAAREGFPDLTGAEFVEFFCKSMRCSPTQIVARIEFEHLLDAPPPTTPATAGSTPRE